MDTTKIEGYENMTPEEKIAALESYEVPDQSDEVLKLKTQLNKACSEAAEYKKQYRATMDEQQRAEAEAKEKAEQIEKKLAEYEQKEKISTYKAEYLALGYDAELANVAAEAKANGDTAKEFECQKTFNEQKAAEFKASLITSQPSLSQGGAANGKTITKEDILNIDDQKKRQELIRENIELFNNEKEK